MRYEVIYPIPEDLYIQARDWPGFTLYHTQAWHQVLERTFGWRVQALLALEDDEIIAYLPFVRKRRLLQKINVALPLSHDVSLAQSLNNSLPETPPDIDLEVHSPILWHGTSQNSDYIVTKLNLTNYSSIDALFAALHKNSIQRKIKKALKNGFEITSEISRTTLDDFTHLQSLTRHRQGTPMYPHTFFHQMATALGDSFHLYLAYHEDDAVAGIVFLYDRKTAIYGYGASLADTEMMRQGVNQLAMWEAIKAAYEDGLSVIDFGLTPNNHNSLRDYKEKWAGSSEPLAYTYKGKSTSIKRNSSSVQLMSQILQRMPLSLFKVVSPYLLREVV